MQNSINEWFRLKFDSGKKVIARLDEEFVISPTPQHSGEMPLLKAFALFLEPTNKVVVSRLMKQDWCLPQPISTPATLGEISTLYVDGSKEYGLDKHRQQVFVNSCERAMENKE